MRSSSCFITFLHSTILLAKCQLVSNKDKDSSKIRHFGIAHQSWYCNESINQLNIPKFAVLSKIDGTSYLSAFLKLKLKLRSSRGESNWQLRATVGQNSSSVQMASAYHVGAAVLAHVARRVQLAAAGYRGPKQQQRPNGLCVPRGRCCFGTRGPQRPFGLRSR